MTTTSYTTVTTAAPAAAGALAPPSRRGLSALLERLGMGSESARRRRIVEATLDISAAAFIGLAFVSPALPADLLFHCAFVTLVLHAFFFGLRGTLLRIALVSIPLLVYADAEAFGLNLPEMELAEWPLMFLIAILVAWMADRRASTSRRYAALFQRASERLLTVEEGERRRIAAELHDGVGQVLTALTLTLDSAASEPVASVARKRVRTARTLADQALADTRDLAHRMRPARLEERGLVPAIRDLAAQSGFDVTVETGPSAQQAQRLPPNTLVEVYRIVQEGLANAARHSGVNSAVVSIGVHHQRLMIQLRDAGHGFDPSIAGSGIGLPGMAERARLIGGRLAIDSAPGEGTTISISVPLPHEQESHA